MRDLLALPEAFDIAILSALWTTKILEGPNRPKRFHGERILTEYLVTRTVADHTRRHQVTACIYETLQYIAHVTHESYYLNYEYIREACVAVVSHGNWVPDLLHILNPQVNCTLAENALALAVHLGLTSIVHTLVEEGVREAETCFGGPLICAVRCAHPSMLTTYLDARLRTQQRLERDVLSTEAVRNSQPERASSEDTSRRGISWSIYNLAIRIAAGCSTPEAVSALIKAATDDGEFGTGSNLGFQILRPVKVPRNAAQDIVLLVAAGCGRFEMVQFALENGANPNAKAWKCSFYSPLEGAAQRGSFPVVKLLLEHGADPYPELAGCCPLTAAVRGGNINVVRILLDAGPKHFDRSRNHYQHPLSMAVSHRRLDLLQLLVAHGITFERGSELDEELAFSAACWGDDDIQALLSQVRDNQESCFKDAVGSSSTSVD